MFGTVESAFEEARLQLLGVQDRQLKTWKLICHAEPEVNEGL